MSPIRLSLILVSLGSATPAALAGQEASCPSVTYGDLVENPITGGHRGTEITITTGQKGCLVLVKIGEGRLRPTQVGIPTVAGDSLSFRLSEGGSFAGAIVRDTLLGRFDYPGAKVLTLPRRPGPTHSHEH